MGAFTVKNKNQAGLSSQQYKQGFTGKPIFSSQFKYIRRIFTGRENFKRKEKYYFQCRGGWVSLYT